MIDSYRSFEIAAEWYHPYFDQEWGKIEISGKEMQVFAYSYYLRFLLFFQNQPEGSLSPGVELEFSGRLKNNWEWHIYLKARLLLILDTL